jgi:hypothetical protein
MSQNPTVQDARNLRTLASQLRQSAFETHDEHYIALFLCGALALEARADRASAPGRLN